tara:strand:- start:68 stop:460 length:393 start_codon:yes stop_codon:yes gene_type:complete
MAAPKPEGIEDSLGLIAKVKQGKHNLSLAPPREAPSIIVACDLLAFFMFPRRLGLILFPIIYWEPTDPNMAVRMGTALILWKVVLANFGVCSRSHAAHTKRHISSIYQAYIFKHISRHISSIYQAYIKHI